jgi:hypothetical protein
MTAQLATPVDTVTGTPVHVEIATPPSSKVTVPVGLPAVEETVAV